MGNPVRLGELWVVKIGSASSEKIGELCSQILYLFQSFALRIVVVHGGSKDIDRRLEEKHLPIRKKDGIRVTDQDTLNIVLASLFGTNAFIKGFLGDYGISVYGHNIAGGRRYKPELGLGLVGQVETVDDYVIKRYLNDHKIPVISTGCHNGQGQIYNVNADIFAEEIAVSVAADRLIFATQTAGVMPKDGEQPFSCLNLEDGWRLVEAGAGIITDGMIPKVKAALWALERNVPEVHICEIGGNSLEAIAEGKIPGTILLPTSSLTPVAG